MEVILKQDVDKVGSVGRIVRVKDGYARNYLIPKGLAVVKSPSNIRAIEIERKRKELLILKEKQKAEELALKLSYLSCSIRVRAGVDERLYGAVTNEDIANALLEEGIQLDKRKIDIEEPIKTIGVYSVPIKLHPEVKANLKVWVVKE